MKGQEMNESMIILLNYMRLYAILKMLVRHDKHANSMIHDNTKQRINTHTHLLDVLFGPEVRRVHQGTHNFEVAVDDHSLIWTVSIDAHPAVVVDRVWQLTTLP